jgi:hypothetical protein
MKELKKLRLKSELSLRKLGELARVPYCNIKFYEENELKSHKQFTSYVIALGKACSLSDQEIVALLKKYSK